MKCRLSAEEASPSQTSLTYHVAGDDVGTLEYTAPSYSGTPLDVINLQITPNQDARY